MNTTAPKTVVRGGLCLSLLLSAPALAQVDTDRSFGGLSLGQRAYVRRHILRPLRDPKHVRFRDIHMVRDVFGWRGSWALCGEIAVRDRSGQYRSYEPFLIAPQGDDPSPIVRNPAADSPSERAGSRHEAGKACGEASRGHGGGAP